MATPHSGGLRVLFPEVDSVTTYSVLRALRPHCEIAVGLHAGGRFSFPSQFCDRSLPLRFQSSSWVLGQTDPGITDEENHYVKQVLSTCSKLRVNYIFPCTEPEVFLFSKAKLIFEERGIHVVAPPFEVFLKAADKYQVTQEASRFGIPAPKTILGKHDGTISETAKELGYPLVLKARFSTGGEWVWVVHNPETLKQVAARLRILGRGYVAQEFIPGSRERSFHVVLDHNLIEISSFVLKKQHHLKSSFSTAIKTYAPEQQLPSVVNLAKRIGVPGISIIQMKEDQRDGVFKLIEVNTRFGNNSRILIPLLLRCGINLPLICLRAVSENGQSPVSIPADLCAAGLVDDLLAGAMLLAAAIKSRLNSYESTCSIPTELDIVRSYVRVFAATRSVDYYTQALFDDPLFGARLIWRLFSQARSVRLASFASLPWGDFS